VSEQAKRILRESPLRVPYLWLANRYRGIKRLFGYPDTARVGVVDYDEYWDAKAPNTMGMLSPWRLRRAQAFATMLRPGDRVLDLGVGDGALLRYLIDTVGIEGYGIDLSPRAVDFCHILGLNVILGDVNRPIHDILSEGFGADSIFDVVICSEIIEHLPDPEALLLSLRAVARKGIIVSIPNTGFHQHRLRLLPSKCNQAMYGQPVAWSLSNADASPLMRVLCGGRTIQNPGRWSPVMNASQDMSMPAVIGTNRASATSKVAVGSGAKAVCAYQPMSNACWLCWSSLMPGSLPLARKPFKLTAPIPCIAILKGVGADIGVLSKTVLMLSSRSLSDTRLVRICSLSLTNALPD